MKGLSAFRSADWRLASSILFPRTSHKQQPDRASSSSVFQGSPIQSQFSYSSGRIQTCHSCSQLVTSKTTKMKDRTSQPERYFKSSERFLSPADKIIHWTIIQTRVFSLRFRKDMAKIIDGKKIAEDIRHELREQVEESVGMGHKRPKLIAVLVGEDPASQTYVNNKMKVSFISSSIDPIMDI